MTHPQTDLEAVAATPIHSTNGTPPENQQDKLETVRAILVGDEFHSVRKRVAILERSEDDRAAKLRNEVDAKFASMHGQTKEEIKGVGDMVIEMVGQLQTEERAHAEEIENIGIRLGDLEMRITEMKDAFSDQIRKMHDDASDRISKLVRLVEKQQHDLSRQSVSRSEFAKVLNGLAGSITHEEAEARIAE